jgi:hypothetical protein
MLMMLVALVTLVTLMTLMTLVTLVTLVTLMRMLLHCSCRCYAFAEVLGPRLLTLTRHCHHCHHGSLTASPHPQPLPRRWGATRRRSRPTLCPAWAPPLAGAPSWRG